EESKHQTAHLMEHAIACGTYEGFSTQEQFSLEFSKNGAKKNARTYDRHMIYIAEAALMEWERILDLLEVEITKPIFTSETLKKEKGNVKEELLSNSDEYARIIWIHTRKATGGTRLTEDERITTIDNIDLSDVEAHYRTTHSLNNMRFTIVGDLLGHKDAITAKLGLWNLPTGQRLDAVKRPPKSAPVICVHRDISNLAFGINIAIDRELSRLERVSMSVLNRILNGSYHSRIFGKARKQGICYHMGSVSSSDISGRSDWWIYGRVGKNNAAALFNLISDQLGQVVKDGVSDEELSSAKDYLLGDYQLKGQTVKNLDEWYSLDYFDNEEIFFMDQYHELIKSVSSQSVVNLAREFIKKGYWTMGAVGDITEEQLAPYYKLFENLFGGRSDL
ncbi:MAG: insulinase family protein, partial [Candidatus Saccharimonadales bacterium]